MSKYPAGHFFIDAGCFLHRNLQRAIHDANAGALTLQAGPGQLTFRYLSGQALFSHRFYAQDQDRETFHHFEHPAGP